MVAEAILRQGNMDIAGFLDDNTPVGTTVFNNQQVKGPVSLQGLDTGITHFVIAIGNNAVREKLYTEFSAHLLPHTVIHPAAYVAMEVTIGSGSVVLAGAVINTGAHIGENCIINSNALVDHDSSIGSHTHIGQSSSVGSGCKITERSWVKPGEIVQSPYYK